MMIPIRSIRTAVAFCALLLSFGSLASATPPRIEEDHWLGLVTINSIESQTLTHDDISGVDGFDLVLSVMHTQCLENWYQVPLISERKRELQGVTRVVISAMISATGISTCAGHGDRKMAIKVSPNYAPESPAQQSIVFRKVTGVQNGSGEILYGDIRIDVDVDVPARRIRSYSLTSPPSER